MRKTSSDPSVPRQAEWTFPFVYKNYSWTTPIPETQVLMNIIDRVKPEFMYSLHNAGFGGAYWYVSGMRPSLWDRFYKAAEKQNVPLNLERAGNGLRHPICPRPATR